MCNTISEDRKVIFENRTHECSFCDDGKKYAYTETCVDCNGNKKFLKGSRHYKCKTCAGNGYTMLEKRIEVGACSHCDGKQYVPLTCFDNIQEEDRQWIFDNLFNFEKPYTAHTSTFNEMYLGFGIVCGITDYGRYKNMTPSEFKEEVKSIFMNDFCQYASILNKEGHLPTEILIKKGESGWNAYPVYDC